ncbi:hypothetical protein LOTGIDRAFT_235523 [Lottia gigantea]|uniref:Uncharacterized protein n=1 Tax=Lottia gigantea TaxID=225164 RepID=V3Z5U5_LOTGI|nr:hypothetical protein LOTGIDRAFT_235523 [Lottia gigantea]ESO86148.1 hypothetical protein LOTGIDRAFT_235523 [Lottia gigantea]
MEPKSCKTMLLFVISSVIFSNVYCIIPHDFNKVTVINTENELENLKSSRNIAVVYYYKRELARIRHFFKEYDKSAEYLAVYGVQAGIVDCTETNKQSPEKCKEAQIQHNIFTYKSGEDLLILDLETMFDVNSIMSNVLQLVLLQEVPIIQNLKDRDELIDRSRGKKDVIFTYQKAEHRIFMEVAFAYQDKYSFAVTTEKEAVANLKESEDITDSTLAVIWVLHCKEKAEKSTDQCIDVKYERKMDLPSLAKFLRALSLPPFIELKTMSDGDKHLKEKLDVVYFLYDKETNSDVKEIIKKYKYDLHGVAGIQLVDKSIMPPEMTEVLTHVKIPGIGVLLYTKNEPVFMSQPWSEKNIYNFLSETLFNKKGEFQGDDDEDDVDDDEVREIVQANNEESVRAKYDLPTAYEVETQDDKVAYSVYHTSKTPMSLDHVIKLKDETFKPTVKDSSILLILFYLHFDAKSMAVLRIFGESAEMLKDEKSQLASLSCYDWTDVCGKQNISRYPTIRLYQNGKYVNDYRGAFDVQAVVNTVKLLQINSPVKLGTNQAVGDFIQGKFPENLNQITNTSVLGVFDKNHKDELKAFKTVIKEYQMSLVFGLTDSEVAKSIVKVKGPAIIIIRHNDQYKKDDGLTSDFTVDNIKSFIQSKKIPTLPELTPMTFPEFYQQGKPLVILFLDETVSIYTKETVATLSKSGQFSQFIFCWMDIHSNQGTGEKILKEYQNEVKVPALSIVNNRKGDVFNFAGEEFTETAITNWLNGVSKQNLQPSNFLKAGEWKPPGRSYDFLAIMDFENEHGGRSPNLTIDSQEEQETENDDKMEDMEARAELIGLGNSRLYKERKTDEPKVAHIHKKDEL